MPIQSLLQNFYEDQISKNLQNMPDTKFKSLTRFTKFTKYEKFTKFTTVYEL